MACTDTSCGLLSVRINPGFDSTNVNTSQNIDEIKIKLISPTSEPSCSVFLPYSVSYICLITTRV